VTGVISINSENVWLGVDTGGTFTDLVLFDGEQVRIHKVLSTPAAPELAILAGLRALGVQDVESAVRMVHGSTVATNAVLEGKGVKTLYITNTGFADVLRIGRQARKHLYQLMPETPRQLIPEQYCLEVNTRLSASGELLQPLMDDELARLKRKVEALQPQAVAVNLLFSFVDDSQEQQIAAVLPADCFISLSSRVLSEYREYERGMATCLNASVGPLMQGYLNRLVQAAELDSVAVMQSSAATVAADKAGELAVHLLLSRPAGGLKGAEFVAAASGYDRLLTFDMGGTSTDVALVDGGITLTSEGQVGDYPVAVPMVDMHTIGAGGGSLAYVDAGGLLQVGPESAGASPGPACYAKGGTRATVTDANLVLGRLPASASLGGSMALDASAARNAVKQVADALGLSIEDAARGIVRIANEHMARALRVMSVQRGVDPAELVLVCFGGAGGLHVCALAQELGMHQALVPVHAGVLSALGMLVASPGREVSCTLGCLLQDTSRETIHNQLETLQQDALQQLAEETDSTQIMVYFSVDCRYLGQSYTLNIPWFNDEPGQVEEKFHESHRQRFGHSVDAPVELVNLRARLEAPGTGFELPPQPASSGDVRAQSSAAVSGFDESVPVFNRQDVLPRSQIYGPAIIVEAVATVFIDAGWCCEMDAVGNLLLHRDLEQ